MADEALTLGLGLELLPESLQKLNKQIGASLQSSSNKFNTSLFDGVTMPKEDLQNLPNTPQANIAGNKTAANNNMRGTFFLLQNILYTLKRIEKNTSKNNINKIPYVESIARIKPDKMSEDSNIDILHGINSNMNKLGVRVHNTLAKSSEGLKSGIVSEVPGISRVLRGGVAAPLVAIAASFVGIVTAGLHFAKADAQGAASLIKIQRGFSLDMFKMMQGLMPGIRKMLSGVSKLVNSPMLGKIMNVLGEVVSNVLGAIVDHVSFLFKLMIVSFRTIKTILMPFKPFFQGVLQVMQQFKGLTLRIQDFFLWLAGSKHTVIGTELGGNVSKVVNVELNKATGGILGHIEHFVQKVFPKNPNSKLHKLESQNLMQDLGLMPSHHTPNVKQNVTNHYHGTKNININIKGNVDKKNVNTLANQISQQIKATP